MQVCDIFSFPSFQLKLDNILNQHTTIIHQLIYSNVARCIQLSQSHTPTRIVWSTILSYDCFPTNIALTLSFISVKWPLICRQRCRSLPKNLQDQPKKMRCHRRIAIWYCWRSGLFCHNWTVVMLCNKIVVVRMMTRALSKKSWMTAAMKIRTSCSHGTQFRRFRLSVTCLILRPLLVRIFFYLWETHRNFIYKKFIRFVYSYENPKTIDMKAMIRRQNS